MKLRISDKHLRTIIDRAINSSVEEAGLLIGEKRKGEVLVKDIVFGRNVENSPVKFRIDGRDVYRAVIEAEKRGLEIVGIFHSHPASPTPSKMDMEGMELWPVLWLIIDSRNGNYAAWSPKGRRIKIIVDHV